MKELVAVRIRKAKTGIHVMGYSANKKNRRWEWGFLILDGDKRKIHDLVQEQETNRAERSKE